MSHLQASILRPILHIVLQFLCLTVFCRTIAIGIPFALQNQSQCLYGIREGVWLVVVFCCPLLFLFGGGGVRALVYRSNRSGFAYLVITITQTAN
jgi:hypothetical protein